MTRAHGNQHASRRRTLLDILHGARGCLRAHLLNTARRALAEYREQYAQAPASTRRRWKCGR